MKREIAIVDFMRYCNQDAGLRFFYASENRNAETACCRISLSFPPPQIFVNLGTVCFSDTSGNKMILTGVRKVFRTHNSLTGLDGFLFESRIGNKSETHFFNVLQR